MNQDKKPHWTSSEGKFHSGKISYYICVSVNCMCACSHVCNCRRICHGSHVEVRLQPWALASTLFETGSLLSCSPGVHQAPEVLQPALLILL